MTDGTETLLSEVAAFAAPSCPDIHVGARRAEALAADAREIADPERGVLLVADAFLSNSGTAARIADALAAGGARVAVYGEIDGDPTEAQVEAVAEASRRADAGLVVGLGGGSAIDTAKLAAALAADTAPAASFALAAKPLPRDGARTLCVPTTAGTGAEVTQTAVISSAAGEKLWYWGAALRPDRAVLDATLTHTLPQDLTAWTGLDAFVHALEASTNRRRSAASELYGHEAMRRMAVWLPRAVADPEDAEARAQALWGATLAGLALNLASTAVAHCASHALASLGAVHHGRATAMGQRVTLAWQIEGEADAQGGDGAFARAAAACGVSRAEFPDWYANFLAECGVAETLPRGFAAVAPATLAAEMRSPANAPMREATARRPSDADLETFAAALLAMSR